MLADVPFDLAMNNLKDHIMTSHFPPTIADIAKQPTKGFYDDHKQLTQKHFTMLEDAKRNAIPMPEHIRKELIGGD